jgi:hypothetical protein
MIVMGVFTDTPDMTWVWRGQYEWVAPHEEARFAQMRRASRHILPITALLAVRVRPPIIAYGLVALSTALTVRIAVRSLLCQTDNKAFLACVEHLKDLHCVEELRDEPTVALVRYSYENDYIRTRMALERGADYNARCRPLMYATPLQFACLYPDALRAFVDVLGL